MAALCSGAMPARSRAASGRLPGRVVAAPSWVIPGTVSENCVFLAAAVDEVGLLFLESAACLAYGKEDLPDSLADLPLSYHVHLPLDLPMDEPARAANICAALLDKAAHLPGGRSGQTPDGRTASFSGSNRPPMRAVLHPPRHDAADAGRAGRLLAAFAEAWLSLGGTPAQLLLENTRDNDVSNLTGPMREYDFGLCLDMGHILAYGQEKLLRRPGILRRAGMLHVNAPGKGRQAGAHLPLTSLDGAGRRQAARICGSVPSCAVIMLELFSWRHIEESLPLIHSWL